jgi:AcrR family transcriptional regulator
MRPAVTLRQRHAEQTRQALLHAAARVFARRGYSNATIDDVAAEAGASKGAVYHHFASKQDLFQVMLAQRAAELGPLRQLPARASSMPELISELVRMWFGRMRDDPSALPLALESRLQALRDPAAAELLASYYRELRSALADLLSQAAQRFGYPRPQPHAAFIVFSLLDGAGQQWAVDPGALRLDQVLDHISQAVTGVFTLE